MKKKIWGCSYERISKKENWPWVWTIPSMCWNSWLNKKRKWGKRAKQVSLGFRTKALAALASPPWWTYSQTKNQQQTLHFIFFLMGIWSQQKAKQLIQHVFPFRLWPRHSTKHALIRTVIKACSWALLFFCFLPPFIPSLSMLSSVISP